MFVALDKDEIHLRKMEGFSIPVFSERSSFFELVARSVRLRDLPV